MAILPADTFQPRVCSQVGTRGGGFGDCGPCTVAAALYVCSGGRFDFDFPPGITGATKRERRSKLIVQIRNRGNMAASGASTYTENLQAFRSYDSEFTALGLTVPKAKKWDHRSNGDFDDFLTEMAIPGRWAFVSVGYQSIINYQGGLIAGQCTGDFNHFILVGRYDGTNFQSVDPLTDGRCSGTCPGPTDRQGCQVADGPQVMPAARLRIACGSWKSNGVAFGSGILDAWSFQPADLLTDPDPEPDPDPDPDPVGYQPIDPCAESQSGED